MPLTDKLAANFIEVAHAQDPYKELVTFRGRIYRKANWRGKAIAFFYVLSHILKKDINPQEKLATAITRTCELFFEKIDDLVNAEIRLRKGLKKKIHGKEVRPTYEESKDSFLSFATAFGPLMNAIRKNKKDSEALKIFSFDKTAPDRLTEQFDYLQSLIIDLFPYQRLYDFEAVTGIEVPLKLIKKMAQGEQLKIREEEKVLDWIKTLQCSVDTLIPSFHGMMENHLVQVHYMHRLFCHIVDFINEVKNEDEPKARVELLEPHLTSLGFKLHDQIDSVQVGYRQNLQNNTKITWKGETLILGKLLENAEMDLSLPVVFAVKNNPDIEVVSYSNESLPYIEHFQEALLQCGVPGKEILGFSYFGQVVIRKRLYHPLSSIKWKSTGSHICSKDKTSAEPIVNLLSQLKDLRFTPYPLLPENFAFTSDQEMRAATCLVPGYYSFEALEDFAYQCSIGKDQKGFNPAVYRHLIIQSGLGKTKGAKRYHRLFDDAIRYRNPDRCITLNQSITDEYLLSRREGFFYAVQDVYEECLREIQNEYCKCNSATLETLKEKMKEYYLKSCSGSILLPSFSSWVKHLTLLKRKPKLKKEQFGIACAKVDEILKNDPAWGSKKRQIYKEGVYHPNQVKVIEKKIVKVKKEKEKAAKKAAKDEEKRVKNLEQQRKREARAGQQLSQPFRLYSAFYKKNSHD